MFNRTLRVDVVKKDKTSPSEGDQLESSFEEKAIIVGKLVGRGITKITVTMVVYVAIDTVRKVAVASASH
jgi:hypothetical protein